MSTTRRGGGQRIVLDVEADYDTAAAEALITAAELALADLLRNAQRRPLDVGLLRYSHDTLRLARETLEVRRRYREARQTGP